MGEIPCEVVAAISPSVPVDYVQPAQKRVMSVKKLNFQGLMINLLSAIALIWSITATSIYMSGMEGEGYTLP
jgi:hypothetical protein